MLFFDVQKKSSPFVIILPLKKHFFLAPNLLLLEPYYNLYILKIYFNFIYNMFIFVFIYFNFCL